MTDYHSKADLQLNVDEGQLMLQFARFCWPIRTHMAPKGKYTWEEVFFNAHGISLDKFKTLMESES